jgi:hypothetical protein
MGCITSFSHSGQYYTLEELAKFDEHGLWHYGDIGFSKHGTLLDTIVFFVNQSPVGMTNSELQLHCHSIVKAALIDLIEKQRLSRAKPAQVYVYVSPDPTKAEEQIKKRQEMTAYSVDDATALRVLLTAYRLVEGSVSSEQIADVLQKEGAKISLEVVQQVFHRYGLGKKTLDFTSFQS